MPNNEAVVEALGLLRTYAETKDDDQKVQISLNIMAHLLSDLSPTGGYNLLASIMSTFCWSQPDRVQSWTVINNAVMSSWLYLQEQAVTQSAMDESATMVKH